MEEALIRTGDLVYIYLDEKRHYLMEVQPKLKLSTDSGDLNFSEIIGKPYGFCGNTHLGRPFYCLKPTTGELMMKIKRRTTIVYPKDLGYLLFETAVGPGSKVVEVGTGSGALTVFLAKFTAPNGMVYSYERNEEFLENAKKNVQKAGFAGNVEFFLRDVGQDGFFQMNVDAVFIDVPEPWDIIPRAATALKGGHHVVSWSPNVEQVKKTFDALKESGFIKIKSSEIIERELLVRDRGIRPKERSITHTAYLTSACKIIKE